MAEAAKIDRLLIQVDVQGAEGASTEINKLAGAMSKLNSASRGADRAAFNRYAEHMKALADATKKIQASNIADVTQKIQGIATALQGVDKGAADNLKTLTGNLVKASGNLEAFGKLKLENVSKNAEALKSVVESIQSVAGTADVDFENFAKIARSISENAYAFNGITKIRSTGQAGAGIEEFMLKLASSAANIDPATRVANALPDIIKPFSDNLTALSALSNMGALAEGSKGIETFVSTMKKIGTEGTKGILPGANAIAGALDKFTSLNIGAFASSAGGLESGVAAIRSFARFITSFKKPADTSNIDSLAATMRKFAEAMSGMPSTFNGAGISAALESITKYGEATTNASAMAKSFEELANALARLGGDTNAENIQKAFDVVSQISESAQTLSKAGNGVGNLARGLAKLPEALSNYKRPEAYSGLIDGLKKFITDINEAIGGFDAKSGSAINNFAKTIRSLATIGDGLDGVDFTTVGVRLIEFIETVNSATGTIGNGDGTSKLRSMVTIITNLQQLAGNHDLTGLVNLGQQLKTGFEQINTALDVLDSKKISPAKSLLKTINELGSAAANQSWISANLPLLADSLKQFFADIGGSSWQISGQIGESFRAVAQMFREIQSIGGGKAAATFANAGNAFKSFLQSIGALSEEDINGVKVASSALWNAIHEIVKANSNLAKTNEKYPEIGKKYDELAQKIVSFAQTITSNITPEMAARFVAISTAIKDLVSSYRSLGPAQEAFGKSTKSAQGSDFFTKGNVTKMLKAGWSGVIGTLKTAAKWYQKLGSAALSASKAVGSLAVKPFTSFINRIKSAKDSWDRFIKSVKRIVFVRMIRAALRKLVDGLKVGIQNLYGWAQLVGNSFVPTMDSLATSFLYLKNSVGAAVSPLLDALAPAIEYVINKIVECINALNQLFAALTGATTWRKAVRKQAAFSDAVGGTGGAAGAAADEIERMLLGIDELNKLPDPNDKSGGGGGGGGGGADYSGMFTVEPIANPFLEWANTDDWTDLGTTISNYLADGLEKANAWMETKGLEMAQSWGTRLATMLSGVFTNEHFSTELGEAIGNGINLATKFVTTFTEASQWDVDLGGFLASALRSSVSKINWTDLGKTMTAEYKIISGILHGFVENWSSDDAIALGKDIATLINSAWNNIPWATAIPDAVTFGTRILETLTAAIKDIKLEDMVSSLTVGIENADWDGFWTQISEALSALSDKDWGSIGTSIGSALNKALTTMQWDNWIPDLVSLGTGILTAINNALDSIKWGPYNQKGTVLNKIWTGVQNADWATLWKQTKEFIKNTWPVWTLALVINFAATLGTIAHTITQATILKAAFGAGGTAAGAGVAGTTALTYAGGVLATVATLALGFALTFDGIKKFTNAVSENDTAGKILSFIEAHLGTQLARLGLGLIFPGSGVITSGWAIALKIGMLLNWNGVEMGGTTVSGDDFSHSSGSFGDGVSIPVTANIVDTDSSGLSSAKKKLSGMTGVVGNTDTSGLSSSKKTVKDMTAKLSTVDESKVTKKQRQLADMKAIMSTAVDKIKAKGKSISGATAVFESKTDNIRDKNFLNKNAVFTTKTDNIRDKNVTRFNAILTSKTDSISNKSLSGFTAKLTSWSKNWSSGYNSISLSAILTGWTRCSNWYSLGLDKINMTANITKVTNSTSGYELTKKEAGGAYYGGGWHNIPQYAGGTTKAHGSLFVAGEAGPEVVGHIGGRTEVLNKSQLASIMHSAITRGMASVINATSIKMEPDTLYSGQAVSRQTYADAPEQDNIWMDNMARKIASQIVTSNAVGDDREIVVMLDSDVLFRSTVKANRKNTIRTGINAMAEG